MPTAVTGTGGVISTTGLPGLSPDQIGDRRYPSKWVAAEKAKALAKKGAT